MRKRTPRDGLTVLDVLALIVVLVIVAGMLIPRPTRPRAPGIKCVNNLKNVGLAFRIFATDNDGLFPTQLFLTNGAALSGIDPLRVFLALSNELSTPKILYCPADNKRQAADSFANLTLKNLSYFASLTTEETEPEAFLAGDRNLQTNGVPIAPGLFPLTTNSVLSWTKQLHGEQGNIAMGDGSVQQFSSVRLAAGLKDHRLGVRTNWLAMP